VFLLLAFVVLPWSGTVSWPESTSTERLLYWTYLANWGVLFVEHQTFPHLWSLAIEEQYYLIWPLLVILLRKRTLALICLFMIISAFLFRTYLVFNFDPEFSSEAMYTFTIARWDSLAIGSLLALLVRTDMALQYVQRYFTKSFIIMSGILSLQIIFIRDFSPHGISGIFNQSSIAIWFAMLIMLSIVTWQNQLDKLGSIFSNRFLRWFGKYSYAIYIFHFPAKMLWFKYFQIVIPPDAPWFQLSIVVYNFIGISLIATVAAFISWHVLEHPFLRLKRYFVN
jgi:peptidoglycan/LPS O-acetylase OafA/YrhL